MMRVRTVLLVLAVSLAGGMAHAGGVDYKKSRIGFTFRQMNVPVEGGFSRFTASIVFDSAKPETGSADIEVDLGSVDTGSTDGDTEVKRKPWFYIENFPKAKFVSTSVKPLGPDRVEVTGTLTIKGRSRDMTIPVALKREAGGTAFEGAFPLLRLQYAIGEGPWSDTETVADEVQVRFRIFVAGA